MGCFPMNETRDRRGRARRGRFSLIECVPRKAHDYLLDVSSNPANFPIQAGSLVRAPHPARGGEGGTTKSRDGKLAWHGETVGALLGNGEITERGTPKPGRIEGPLGSQSGKANAWVVG